MFGCLFKYGILKKCTNKKLKNVYHRKEKNAENKEVIVAGDSMQVMLFCITIFETLLSIYWLISVSAFSNAR